MADEISLAYTPGAALYAVARTARAEYLDGTTAGAFAADRWTAYAIALAELAAGSGQFAGTFPAAAPGLYGVDVYLRAGATPAPSDGPPVASGSLQWDGAAEVVSAPTQLSGAAYQFTAAALALAPSASFSGVGNVVVDQDTGGTNNLTLQDPDGNGVGGATVRAYLAGEWAAGPLTAAVRGMALTVQDGAWGQPMHLDAGAYTFVFSAPGYEDASINQQVTD
jgi:hypothetical protein